MNGLSKVQLAFLAWQETFPANHKGLEVMVCTQAPHLKGQSFKIAPNWDGKCPCPDGAAFHGYYEKTSQGWDRYIQRPDHKVCERERRWRRYVQLRDMQNLRLC
jgi:hypothetical protein